MASLETVSGTLEDVLARVDHATIQHAREITSDRRTQLELREQWFWTADFPMYRLERGAPVLYFAGREHNLVFANIAAAVAQIKACGNFLPSKSDEARVVRSARTGETLRLPLADLALHVENEERAYFVIDTARSDDLNPAQRALAERIYGIGDDLRRNMEVLRVEGRVPETRVYVLNPQYVREHARAGALGRVSWLDDFYDGLLFIVLDRDIGSANGFLRAVPLSRDFSVEDGRLTAAFTVVMERVGSWTPAMYAAFSRAITARLERAGR